MRGNWTERRRMLSDGPLAHDADLLTLQETIVDDGYDQAADVLDSRSESSACGRRPPAGAPPIRAVYLDRPAKQPTVEAGQHGGVRRVQVRPGQRERHQR